MELFQVGKRRFMTQKKLGEGAFGVVHQVKDQTSAEVLALKDIRCENESTLNTALSEARNLYKVVSHKNIITIQGVDTYTDHSGSRHFFYFNRAMCRRKSKRALDATKKRPDECKVAESNCKCSELPSLQRHRPP